ncbi:ATP-binding protein [Bifidobacterium samirii]|uniref:AAA ATPase n=1 Tax=Bifidobacterium samirii TaxID=2306974 RepID=A0A430FV90_9BIFI|nr:ATP-binding protein [Bifidobacterium samirii]RSX57474.1 AAA ATPase [Bifidobacterium samirii]
MANPFKPTAGMTPPVLVGRESDLDDFRYALDDGVGAPGRLMYLTGARGVGKTVMLNALGDIARDQDWLVIDETAERGFMDRLIRALNGESATRTVKYQTPGLTLDIPGGLGQATVNLGAVELEHGELSLDFRHAMTRRLDGMDESRRGILITLDEVQSSSIDEIRALAVGVQHLIRERRNIAFVFAGLPSLVEDVVNDDVLTFLRRAERRHLGDVPLPDIWSAFETTISDSGKNVDYEILNRLTQATNGYPFMIQLVGYWTWRASETAKRGDRITMEDADSGIRQAKLKLGDMVHGPIYDGLTAMQKDYLLAMSQDDGPSSTSEIARRLERSAQYASVYRAQLIKLDIITASDYGFVDFKVPHMREYLRSHAVHHQMRRTIEDMA